MANKNKVTITSDLKNDLKKYANNFSIGMATYVRDEMYESSIFAIESFYADYTPEAGNVSTSYNWKYVTPTGTPKSYKRHYTNFLTKSFSKYYKNPHNSIVYGGIYLSPEKMEDYYQDNTEEVFDMVYHGYHGVSSGFDNPKRFTSTPVMSPSPLEIIEQKFQKILKNIQKNKKKGSDRAEKGNYSTIY